MSLEWETNNFFSNNINKLSSESVDFVKQLLIKNPNQRPYIKEILVHPWIENNCDVNLINKRINYSNTKDNLSDFLIFSLTFCY